MKKNILISPVGLKGNEINERMKELMGIKPINENENKSTSVVELTKMGPDGKAYAIVRENHEYYIKSTNKTSGIIAEDFKYIGGLMNKKSEAYPSYAKAIKQLNLKFRSLAEAYNFDGEVNVFQDDNLLSEDVAGRFADHPKGGGFTGEGNLEGNTPLPVHEEEEIEPDNADEETEGLTEVEKAVDDMGKEKIDEDINPKLVAELKAEIKTAKDSGDNERAKMLTDKLFSLTKGSMKENKLSISRAIEQMDDIIDTLTEGKIKKKVYTIK